MTWPRPDPHATEPTAAVRGSAAHMWRTYSALVQQGFTADQALHLTGQMAAGYAAGVGYGQTLNGDTP